MKTTIRTLSIACILALTACAAPLQSVTNLPTHDAEGTPLDQGLIVGSVTAGSRTMNVLAQFASTDGQGYRGRVQSQDDLGYSAREYDLRYNNVFGDVFVMKVPAGNYAFYQWQMNTSETEQSSPETLQPLAFTVKPGETVYLGNIHFPLLGTRETEGGGPRIPTDTWAIANNRELRDAEAIYARQPELKNRLINRRPLDSGVWRADYKALTGHQIADPMH